MTSPINAQPASIGPQPAIDGIVPQPSTPERLVDVWASPMVATAAARISPGVARPRIPGTLRPQALLSDVAVKRRNETFGSYTVSLWTTDVTERPAKSDPTLRTVDATKLFRAGTVFFGFGKPNVYLGIVGDQCATKVAAKSLWREPATVATSPGNVQSGIFLVPRNLSPQAVDAVVKAATLAEGSRNITCVATNTRILSDAGFTLNGGSIKHTWPVDLLTGMVSGRVEYNGERVFFDIIRTTPQKLDPFLKDVAWAVKTTPYRHAPSALKYVLYPVCGEAPATIEPPIVTPRQEALLDPNTEAGLAHSMYFSVPSRLGGAMRSVWGPHPIISVQYPEDLSVDDYLPQSLKAFDIKNPGLTTRVKRDLIFSRPVQKLLRHGLAKSSTEPQMFCEANVPDMIDSGSIYNLAVTTDGLKFMAIEGTTSRLADWVLSKHVLVAGDHADVRFAGEMWKTDDNVLHINRNSGTYRPSAEQLQNALRLAHQWFPTLKIDAEEVVT